MTAQDVIDKYSPLLQGQTGVQKFALLLVSRTLQIATDILGRAGQYPFNQGYTNTAGQTISDCSPSVAVTLQRMERKLQNSFNKAAQPALQALDDVKFLMAAEEVRSDAQILRPLFNARSGVNHIGGEDYKFMVTGTLDLDAAVKSVNEKLRNTTPVLAALA